MRRFSRTGISQRRGRSQRRFFRALGRCRKRPRRVTRKTRRKSLWGGDLQGLWVSVYSYRHSSHAMWSLGITLRRKVLKVLTTANGTVGNSVISHATVSEFDFYPRLNLIRGWLDERSAGLLLDGLLRHVSWPWFRWIEIIFPCRWNCVQPPHGLQVWRCSLSFSLSQLRICYHHLCYFYFS